MLLLTICDAGGIAGAIVRLRSGPGHPRMCTGLRTRTLNTEKAESAMLLTPAVVSRQSTVAELQVSNLASLKRISPGKVGACIRPAARISCGKRISFQCGGVYVLRAHSPFQNRNSAPRDLLSMCVRLISRGLVICFSWRGAFSTNDSI